MAGGILLWDKLSLKEMRGKHRICLEESHIAGRGGVELKYILGIDIGIASVGWCVLNYDKKRIEDLGTRTFVAAEHPKDGRSLAEPRRLARDTRRRLRRRAHRLERLRGLLVREGVLPLEAMASLYSIPLSVDQYTLRARALEHALGPEDWARVLLHIAKRRGFKSNRKSEEREKESGQVLCGIEANKKLLAEKGYRTVGEMLCKDEKFSDCKRNKGGRYLHTVSRAMLTDELHALFAAQRRLGNPHAGEGLETAFCQIFLAQRPFAASDDILKLVGECTFEKGQLRAAKHSYTAERFVLLQKINNLKLLLSGGKTGLTEEQRQKILRLAYDRAELKYAQIRKELVIPDEWQFAGLSYYRKGEAVNPETAKFVALDGFHKLKKAITDRAGKTAWGNIAENIDRLDDLAFALTFFKTDEDIQKYLREKEIPDEIIQAVLTVSFEKVQHLSIKAMRKVIPYLETGLSYGDACEKAGYCHWSPAGDHEKHKYLPPITKAEMRNPVVLRALAQSRKVINAIIRRFGSPYRIHVEVARELAKPWQERREIKREQDNYQQRKEQWKAEFKELYDFDAKSEDLLKYRLWKEQGNRCAYTGDYLSPDRLLEPGYAEVDHILPYSRSLDDSMANKVLVKGAENRNKGDRAPFEYMGGDQARWHKFEEWVRAYIKSGAKRNRLLRQSFGEKEEEELKSRNLNDTRYISRYLAQMLKEHIAFENTEDKNPVLMINGQMTAFLRAKWGLLKIREDGDLHHALDAAVIAAASNAMVGRITGYSKADELRYHLKNGKYIDMETGEIKDGPYKDTIDVSRFPRPWEKFREEIVSRLSDTPADFLEKFGLKSYTAEELAALKPVFVSRAPSRKVTGAAHKETVLSAKCLQAGFKLQKRSLADLNWDKGKSDFKDDIFGKERDWRLYEALRDRVRQNGGDVKKAFSTPFYKPVLDGKQDPPLVRSVKICVAGTSGVPINGGLAENGEMVKVLVYAKDGKYYFVPVYVADMVKNVVPDRAITVGKPESAWTIMDSTYTFKFTLYPNDLIHVKRKEDEFIGYYKQCNRNNSQVLVESHDRRKIFAGKDDTGWLISVGTILSLDKLQVDPLGNYTKVKQERP
jgi:CRISPR-associated endonuclease Csn1